MASHMHPTGKRNKCITVGPDLLNVLTEENNAWGVHVSLNQKKKKKQNTKTYLLFFRGVSLEAIKNKLDLKF